MMMAAVTMGLFLTILSAVTLTLCTAFAPVSRIRGLHRVPWCSRTSSYGSKAMFLTRRDDYMQNKSTSAFATLFAFGASLVISSSPMAASAFDASVFNHDYADPFHPLCERHIQVAPDGATFHYSGTAVGPKDDTVLRGCSAQEIRDYKLRKGAFDGIILKDGKISAGDGIHEGVWEPAGSASTSLGYEDKDGIRWNDGNKWVVIDNEPSAWEQGFKNFTLLYIFVSLLAGAKELTKRAKDATSS